MKMLALAPNKRKAFVYVSNGYYFDLQRAANDQPGGGDPFLETGKVFTLDRLRSEVAELARQARRSNVTIFGIDPRALSGSRAIDPNIRDAAWQQYWTTTTKSLQVIAEPTGGRVIQDDLDGNLKRLRTEMR